MLKRQGLMLVLSSPSGAGKTSIARALLKRDPGITMSVSATTRQRRPGETEGKDYFFVDEHQFKTDVNKGLFLEYAQVFDHYYGTPLRPVQDTLAAGGDVLQVDHAFLHALHLLSLLLVRLGRRELSRLVLPR